MENTNKFPLYELLAMVIPGGIIIATFWLMSGFMPFYSIIDYCCGYSKITYLIPEFLFYAIFITIAYVLGLINNWIADGIFKGFRNNPTAIKNELLKVLYTNNSCPCKYYINCQTYYRDEIKPLYTIAKIILKDIGRQILKSPYDLCINHEYFSSYYHLARLNLLGAVPRLESQVALLRNMILPLILLIVSFCIFKDSYCYKFETLVVSIINLFFLFILMVQRQNKIYYNIWEASIYYGLPKI